MTNFFLEDEKKNIKRFREVVNSLPLFCKDFFRSIEPRTTFKTRLAYAYDLTVFFNYLKTNNDYFKKNILLSDLDKLTLLDIEEYIEYLKYYNSNDKEVFNSNEGIKRKIASLKSFYNYYYKSQLIKNNPINLVQLPKLREKEIIRLEPDEVAKLIDLVETGELLTESEKKFHNITKDRDVAIFTLLLGTGIRISECIGINIEDIDFETDAIKITRKGGKEVFIYFSDEIYKYLKIYYDKRINYTHVYEPDKNALFLSIQNKRISARAIQKLIKKYAKIITPLKHITPHKLRSTFGTNLYRETGDIYLVANVLGHKDVNTTRKHYAAIEDDARRKVRNKVKLKSDV